MSKKLTISIPMVHYHNSTVEVDFDPDNIPDGVDTLGDLLDFLEESGISWDKDLSYTHSGVTYEIDTESYEEDFNDYISEE